MHVSVGSASKMGSGGLSDIPWGSGSVMLISYIVFIQFRFPSAFCLEKGICLKRKMCVDPPVVETRIKFVARAIKQISSEKK